MADALLGEELGEVHALLDARGADEDGLAGRVALGDVLDDLLELRLLVLVDEVGLVLALHGPVRGDRDDAELVGAHELGGLGLGRAGHAGELLVEAEVVLQRDGGEGLVLGLDRDALLRLDGLVDALVVAAAHEDAARVLVDDEHLDVHDDVVLVLLEQGLGLDRVVEERDERGVRGLVEVVDAEVVLDLLDARLKDADRALLLVDLVVDLGDEALGHGRELREPAVRIARGRARDDERRAGLVDEDGVDLVHHGEEVAALDHVGRLPRHVVAQVVEAELVVRAVRDVGGVLLAALLRGLAREDHARGHAEGAEHAAHELALVAGEVVVDRDDVHAARCDGVEVGRQGGDQGLALARLHLGDVAEVEGRAAHDLDVEVAEAERTAGRLADRGEGLGEEVVEGLAVGVALAQLDGLVLQLLVGEVREVLLELVHRLRVVLQLAERAPLADAKDLLEY